MTWLRFCPHSQMLRFLAKDWILVDELHGTNHGHWSVLLQYSGEGEPTD